MAISNHIFNEMQRLPTDLICIIASFMTLEELNNSHQATSDFSCPKQKRTKRFRWCADRITKRPKIKLGYCADITCNHTKVACIQLEPELQTVVLSNYCAEHTKQYINTDAIHFV